VLELGTTDKRGPPRQYHTVSRDVDSETAAEIADSLKKEKDWTEVT